MPDPSLRVVPLRGLEPESRARWQAWATAPATGGSPFHHPRYHELVDAARRDHGLRRVELVLLRDGQGRDVAALPFERGPDDGRDRGPDGAPVDGHPSGRQLTDHQGWVGADGARDVLARPTLLIDAVRAAGLTSLRFDHLVAAQAPPEVATSLDRSPVIDLRVGHAAYLAATHAARVEARKGRRLVREVGELRFEPFVVDPTARAEVLEALVAWKSAQYRATDRPDLFARDWCRTAVTAVASEPYAHGFGGAVSALWAGGRLVAAHAGLRSASTWHWWLPAYDPAFARHSPGTVLLLAMVEHAPAVGLDVVDLGKGDEPYKARLANGAVEVASGRVELPSTSRTARRAARGAARRLAGVVRHRPRPSGSA